MISTELVATKEINGKNYSIIKYCPNFSLILFLDGASIELEDAQEIVDLKETLYEPGEEMLVLVKSDGMLNISKEAMKLLSDHDTPNNVIVSTALIVENLGLRIIANFFMARFKPVFPTKIFRNTNSAIKWSKDQLSIYQNINKILS